MTLSFVEFFLLARDDCNPASEPTSIFKILLRSEVKTANFFGTVATLADRHGLDLEPEYRRCKCRNNEKTCQA